MYYLSLDLEMNQPSGKIIQIGAVIGNVLTGAINETFSRIVRIDEPLNPKIEELTGITASEVSAGVSLEQAYLDLCEFKKKYDCQTNPITWGGGDSLALKQELEQYSVSLDEWPFGRRWIDIKTVYQFYCLSNGIKIQSGLAKSLTRLGLAFKGKKHNAKDDAMNTLIIAHALLKKIGKLQ